MVSRFLDRGGYLLVIAALFVAVPAMCFWADADFNEYLQGRGSDRAVWGALHDYWLRPPRNVIAP